MSTKSVDLLLAELREANAQYDSGHLSKDELKTILYEVYYEYKNLDQPVRDNPELLKFFLPINELGLA